MKRLIILLLCALLWTSCAKIRPITEKIASISFKKKKKEAVKVEETTKKEEVVLVPKKETNKTNNTQNQLVKTARKYLGTPHRMGGMDRKGIDCSGLMCVTFKDASINLPRTSSGQSTVGKSIKKSDLKVGDLLFFGAYKGSKQVTHVGMVSSIKGKDEVIFIHTSTRRGVVEDDFYFKHWQDTFIRAKRVL